MRFVFVLMFCLSAFAQRQVAITIDDLPIGGDGTGCEFTKAREVNLRLLKPFRERKLPLTGFVNAGRCGWTKEQLEVLRRDWTEAGAELGNHGYSHRDLNTVPLTDFQADVEKGHWDGMRYFRHPFLHTGGSREKRDAFEKWLRSKGYIVAPVTIDNSDYMFAAAYKSSPEAEKIEAAYLPYLVSIFDFFEKRSVEVIGREIAQILLLHVNELNARKMPELLDTLHSRGYRIVSLDEALRDEAYKQMDGYYGPGGFSWIHRWSRTKGMPGKGEPEEPAFVAEEYKKSRATSR